MEMNKKNRFDLNELSGALGDLGILVPISFALITINGFSPFSLFLLWGLTYLLSGWYFKIPLSVQPLKAMAVICIASGFEKDIILAASVLFGIVMILLSVSGIIDFVRKWFSRALIRGIQLGIGLILAWKALSLILDNGTFLSLPAVAPAPSFGIFLGCTLVLVTFQRGRKRIPITLPIVALGVGFGFLLTKGTFQIPPLEYRIGFKLPDLSLLSSALVLLVLPQLPLTLGNAVYSASDVAKRLFKKRAEGVTVRKLSLSIGVFGVLMGLLGGFPICHGAGGLAAHHRFGGRTGGATMILGGLLISIAIGGAFLIESIYLIPVPLLGSLLLLTSWEMVRLTKDLRHFEEISIALVVAFVSFFTRNLFVAIIVGILWERLLPDFAGEKIGLLFRRVRKLDERRDIDCDRQSSER
jgi:SulP family sulfate permease